MSIEDRIREILENPDFMETLILVSRMTPEQLERFMPFARRILQQDRQEKTVN